MGFLIMFAIDSLEFLILSYFCSHLLNEEVYLQLSTKTFHRKMFVKISLIFSKFMAYINEFLQSSAY